MLVWHHVNIILTFLQYVPPIIHNDVLHINEILFSLQLKICLTFARETKDLPLPFISSAACLNWTLPRLRRTSAAMFITQIDALFEFS